MGVVRHTDLDFYQEQAHSTALYPAVYHERQVMQMMGFISGLLPELHQVEGGRLADAVEEAKQHTDSMAVLYAVLGLAGEAGEVSEKVKKLIRDGDGEVTDEFREEIKKELGDVLWYLSEVSYQFGLSLGEVARANLEKLASRKERGQIQGSGDNR